MQSSFSSSLAHIYSIDTHRPLLPLYVPAAPGRRPRCPGPRPESFYPLAHRRKPGDRQAARPGSTQTTIYRV